MTNRDELKQSAEEALFGKAWGETDRELYLDEERREFARALLAYMEREDAILRYLKARRTQVRFEAQELDAAIKAAEEGRDERTNKES